MTALWSPARVRPALIALWALELELWSLPVRLRDPLATEMRLAWWRDALIALKTRPAPAQPVLEACAAYLVPLTGGEALDALEDAPLMRLRGDEPEQVALRRGSVLTGLTAKLLGHVAPEGLGLAWAAGEACRTGDRVLAAPPAHVAKPLRPLLALDRLGARDQRRAVVEPRGSLVRQALIARTILTG